MFIAERKWLGTILSPISISNRIVTVSTTKDLFVKQIIALSKSGVAQKEYQIKRVLSSTQFYVGELNTNITQYADPSAYDGGTLTAGEQNRPVEATEVALRASYQEEPAVALRTLPVSPTGIPIDYPAAQIELVEPDVRLIYGSAMEVTSIRERTPSSKLLSGTFTFNHAANSITLTQIPYWIMLPNCKFAVVDGGGTNIDHEFTVLSYDTVTNIVTVIEAVDDFTSIATLDGSIGENVKVTNLIYDASYNVIKIYNSTDTVTLADLL